MYKKYFRLFFFVIFSGLIVYLYAIEFEQILSFETLRYWYNDLVALSTEFRLVSPILFIVLYIFLVVFAIPGAVWLTVLGGAVFGTVKGAICVLIGASIGAILFFLITRFLLYEWLRDRVGSTFQYIELRFKEHAISYLLFLRLVPLFPFWVVNAVPALLGISLPVYAICTCIGIVPGTLVYASLGDSLGVMLSEGGAFKLDVVFEPLTIFSLIGAFFLLLTPIIASKARKKDS